MYEGEGGPFVISDGPARGVHENNTRILGARGVFEPER